jgi:hypothetical protein
MIPCKTATLACALAGSLLGLSACSSGDPAPFNNPPPPGVYAGSVYNNAGANAHRFIVRTDGSFWILLGAADPGRFFQAGFVQGSNLYTSGYAVGTLYDTLNPAGVLVNMNTVESGGLTLFSGNLQLALTGANSTFEGSNHALSAFSAQGPWSVQDAYGRAINLNIGAAGPFSATTAFGCVFSGALSPTVLGGFFDVSVSDPAGCLGPAFSVYLGIGITETPPAGLGQQLLIAASGAGRGISLSGVR